MPDNPPACGLCTGKEALIGVVAASIGLVLGMANGGIGAAIAHKDFQELFLAGRERSTGGGDMYCHFSDPLLQLSVSCLFLAAAAAAAVSSWTCDALGRKKTMVGAGALSTVGTVLCASSHSWAQLVLGRLLIGAGVGAACVSSPLYLSEIAPAHHRGKVNFLFQLCLVGGIFLATVVSYPVAQLYNGWRLVMGLAGGPGLLFMIGVLLLPETPSWLLHAGRDQEAQRVLENIRGTLNINAEFNELQAYCTGGGTISTWASWKALFSRRCLFQLVMCLVFPMLQQLTGINAVMFYAPQILMAVGESSDAALLSSVIVVLVSFIATLVAMSLVDSVGRKPLLLQGGMQMFVTLVPCGVLIMFLGISGESHARMAQAIVALMCVYVAGFAWSWGPLGWLLPIEVQPQETRAAGTALNIIVSNLWTFVVGQMFLSMLCTMKYAVFFFFAGWVLVMSIFVAVFVPETKGIPLEALSQHISEEHPIWSRLAVTPHRLPSTGGQLQATGAAT